MKMTYFMVAVLMSALTACSSTKAPHRPQQRHDAPETVMVTYHIKPGMEAVFQDALGRAWAIYRKENLVFAEPRIVLQDLEGGDRTRVRVVEIFTWVSHAAPEHTPDSVKQLWAQMQSLCQARDGHGGLEGGEVELLTPKNR